MKFWIDISSKNRLRLWIGTYFHKSYEKNNFIFIGLFINKEESDYGIILFNYYCCFHFKCRIDLKTNIISYAWYHKEQSFIGFKKEE